MEFRRVTEIQPRLKRNILTCAGFCQATCNGFATDFCNQTKFHCSCTATARSVANPLQFATVVTDCKTFKVMFSAHLFIVGAESETVPFATEIRCNCCKSVTNCNGRLLQKARIEFGWRASSKFGANYGFICCNGYPLQICCKQPFAYIKRYCLPNW